MNRILLYILVLGTLCGCSTDHVPTPVTPEEEVDGMGCTINFSTNRFYDVTTESRAGIIEDNYLPQGSVVGIYALKTIWQEKEGDIEILPTTWAGNHLQYDFKNEPYQSEGNSGKLTSVNASIPRFPSYDNAALSIYAYYPHSTDIVYNPNATKPSAPKVKVKINHNPTLTEDFLYTGKIDAYPQGEPTKINLPFKHALARLRFKLFTNDVSFTNSDCHKLTKIVVKTNNNQIGYMNLENGDINGEDGQENTEFEYILPKPYEIVASKKGDATLTEAEFLLIPDENAINEIILYVKDEYDNEQAYTAYSYYPRKNDPKRLMAGKVHTVNVEYRSRANFECAITAWVEEIIQGEDVDIDEDNEVENENFKRIK